MLESPCLDDRQVTESSSWDVPVAVPARSLDVSRLPPTFISVGAVDGLRDECEEFAERLHDAGVHAVMKVYEGAPHLFAAIAPTSEVAASCRRDQLSWLSDQFHGPVPGR